MSKGIQAVRGMNDILPEQAPVWSRLEAQCRAALHAFDYRLIRLPIIEKAALFKRSIGDVTDIVEKEMYTFDDRHGELLALRPEGTAVCVRAGIQHGLLYNQVQRLWYMGPMFRHERPQKGRYRQFHQLGVEAFGLATPETDVEMIVLSDYLWKQLALSDHVKLQLNTLGKLPERQLYKEALQVFLRQHYDALDADSQRRLETNPLRVLDSKNRQTQAIVREAPLLKSFLSQASLDHFDRVCARLDALGIAYEVNPCLVRGLDYYNDTVFEWVTDALGAQGTVCAGGRYDSLVAMLGGKDTPAVGMAMGLERLVTLMQAEEPLPAALDVSVAVLDDALWTQAWQCMARIRAALPAWSVRADLKGGALKAQLKRAHQAQARYALILGQEGVPEGQLLCKDLLEGTQQTLDLDGYLALWCKQGVMNAHKE